MCCSLIVGSKIQLYYFIINQNFYVDSNGIIHITLLLLDPQDILEGKKLKTSGNSICLLSCADLLIRIDQNLIRFQCRILTDEFHHYVARQRSVLLLQWKRSFLLQT